MHVAARFARARVADARQQAALASLDALLARLLAARTSTAIHANQKTSKYLVGSVGSGKTLLMDTFNASLLHECTRLAINPFSKRVHFLEFMASVHCDARFGVVVLYCGGLLTAIDENTGSDLSHQILLRYYRQRRSIPFILLSLTVLLKRQLNTIRKEKPKSDPFETLATQIKTTTPVLCLDEFQLTDIGDAMVLRRLFESLYRNATTTSTKTPFTLITTSNKQINELYAKGINRELVRPLLKVLENHCEVIELDGGGVDYRRMLGKFQNNDSRVFYHPPTTSSTSSTTSTSTPTSSTAADVRKTFLNRFTSSTSENNNHQEDIHSRLQDIQLPHGRKIQGLVNGRKVLIPFETLCGNTGKLGGADYIKLCMDFEEIFISGPVERFDLDAVDSKGTKSVDLGRRFINLIDVAYDSRVRLVVEAVAGVEEVLGGLETEQERELVKAIVETRVLKEGGSSSSSATTYVGMMEWSATGLQDASLASIGGIGVSETVFAVERAISRVIEMGSWTGENLKKQQ